jgi:3-oxoacyl-ACP reductase-like protein
VTPGKQAPPTRVPTLTEVVKLPDAPAPAAAPAAAATAPDFVERRANWPPIQEEQIVQRVLADLQRQIDLMLETRMRETLTPALTRATDALVRDLRHELASTLRDVVAHAVAQELARHRGR